VHRYLIGLDCDFKEVAPDTSSELSKRGPETSYAREPGIRLRYANREVEAHEKRPVCHVADTHFLAERACRPHGQGAVGQVTAVSLEDRDSNAALVRGHAPIGVGDRGRQ
jgi:hypothetical protein